MVFRFVSFLMFLCVMMPAIAQSQSNPDRNKPLEITADESLEWHRNELFFKAKKNVKAKQGDTTLLSDTLVAKYRESQKSNMDIYLIQANGHVKIMTASSTAYGDKAIYDVDKGYAVMTGKNLKLVSEDQTVTAKEKMQYWVNQGKLEAIGDAVAIREGDRLEADKMIAIFVEDKQGKRVLKSLEAIGNVIITTPTEVLEGDHAFYNAGTSLAELKDNVRITRGPNVLEGARAELNLQTNVSKIFGSNDGSSGRVKGVFFPKSDSAP